MNENIENVIETEAIPEAEAIRVVVANNDNGRGVAKKVAIGAAVITVVGGIVYGIIKALKNKPAADQDQEEVVIDITDCDCEDDDAEDDDEDDSEETEE